MLKKSPVAFSMPEERISLFARESRDLRETRDWSEVSSARVAPLAHVSPGSLTLHERRTKRTACLSLLLVLPFCSPVLCAANGRVIRNLSFFNDSPLARARLLLDKSLIAGEAQSDARGSTPLCHCHPPDGVAPALHPPGQPDTSFLFRIVLQQTSIVIDRPWPVTPLLSDPQGFWMKHMTRLTPPKHLCWLA
jgi:hypothetical protein